MVRRIVGVVLVLTVAVPLSAQTPSPRQAKHLLREAEYLSRKIVTIDQAVKGLRERLKVLQREFQAHNAKQCEFPRDHPEVCDWYEREVDSLNVRREALISDVQSSINRREQLFRELQAIQARMRDVPFSLKHFTKAERQVLFCVQLKDAESAMLCTAGVR